MPYVETLARIDAACRRVAAATARPEPVGSLVVFHPWRGFPLAARPASRDGVGVPDVREMVDRQLEAGIPVRIEWIDDLDPTTRDAAIAAGLTVTERPLLVLREPNAPSSPPDVVVRMIDAADPEFVEARSAVDAGFRDRDVLETERSLLTIIDRAEAGALRACAARDPLGAVGGGTSSSVGWSIVELTGIAVLPRARRRGIGASVTYVLATDAVRTGAELVWLSATDGAAASVYEAVGFRRAGTVCVASPSR